MNDEIKPGHGFAAFRLPMPLNGLSIITDAIERIYGTGEIMVRYEGDQMQLTAPKDGFGPVKHGRKKVVEDTGESRLIKSDLSGDKMTFTLEEDQETMQVLGEIAMRWFKAVGGINYVEMKLQSKTDEGEFVYTVQRKDGKTPTDLRLEAEARVAELEALLPVSDPHRENT